MKKEESNIDELLNGCIDGELSERQLTEIQRLIAHDEKVARRLWELQRCKMLISSLPAEDAPADMLWNIKATLERRSLLGSGESDKNQRHGARHLFMRKVLSYAAMLALVAGLLILIIQIVTPTDSRKGIFVGGEGTAVPAPITGKSEVIVKNETPSEGVKVNVKPSFNATLRLDTTNLVAFDAAISKIIEEHGLLQNGNPELQKDKSVYQVNCNREGLEVLLAELDYIWGEFDKATLLAGVDDSGKGVAIDNVTTEQIRELAGQADIGKREQLAKDFSVRNSIEGLTQPKNTFAVIDKKSGELKGLVIPKPVLTSGENTAKKVVENPEDPANINLRIEVTREPAKK